MASDDRTMASLPRTLLQGVSWTFRGTAFGDRATFDAAVAKSQNPHKGKPWQPAEIVLHTARMRITPDVGWYLSDEHPTLELTADDGVRFTAGELLFKVHNAFVVDLREMDHKFFEGFTLADEQDAAKPPLYNLDLGS
jgi:hypothetical protein